MHILVAPNAFKKSLDATAAAAAISRGFQASRLTCTCTAFPVGDGGDGTAGLITSHLQGELVPVVVSDPLGRKITSRFGLIDGGRTAVIEMADAAGLRLLQPRELNPLTAGAWGTGEMITAALDRGVKKVILGMGGSATVDGGRSILEAVGVVFRDASGAAVEAGADGLGSAVGADLSGLDPRLRDCAIDILCDVDNGLLGPHGAAAVFGPQKGATASQLPLLEAALARLSGIALLQTGKDMSAVTGGGTAGGAAAGLYAFLGAGLVPGIGYFLDITRFDDAIPGSGLLVTGEGCIDDQSLHGKAPVGVAVRGKRAGMKVIGLAGMIPQPVHVQFRDYFDALLCINDGSETPATMLLHTRINLERTAFALGNQLAAGDFPRWPAWHAGC